MEVSLLARVSKCGLAKVSNAADVNFIGKSRARYLKELHNNFPLPQLKRLEDFIKITFLQRALILFVGKNLQLKVSGTRKLWRVFCCLF